MKDELRTARWPTGKYGECPDFPRLSPDELIQKGNLADAYRLASHSPMAQEPEVKARIERITPQAKALIAAQETEQRRKKEAELLAQAKELPVEATTMNRDVYDKLRKLVPDNKKYQEKFAHYDGLLKKDEQERQDHQKKFGAVPERSAWDGSYYEVEHYLKRVANDPDSIKMDGCTKVYSGEDGWLVGCDYRGRNAFGGMIRQSNWFTIRNGQVVRMEPASAHIPLN